MQSKSQSGFALLMALIVVGVVFSIGLTLLDLSIKQVKLSTMAKDSEIAFHAANAGMECARYTRRILSDNMENGLFIEPSCFNEVVGTNSVDPDYDPTVGDGEVHKYDYDFTWGPPDAQRCTKITTLVASTTFDGSGTTLSGMPAVIAGYPTENFTCDAGGRCTVISVRGYNKPCTATFPAGTIQREVLAEF